MSKKILSLAVIAIVTTTLNGLAEDDRAKSREARIKEAIKKFDKDGDGKLNEQEREAAKAEFAKNRGKRPAGGQLDGRIKEAVMKRFDKNGNGKLDEDEKAAMEAARKEVIAKFDKNGNGKIDDDERKALRDHLIQEHKLKLGDRPAGDRPKGDRPNGDNAGKFREMIKRFDKDGDGKLSEAEKAAAKKFIEENRGKGGFDRPARPDGDAAPKKRENKLNQDLLKKFDADGDGELNAEERKAARAAREGK